MKRTKILTNFDIDSNKKIIFIYTFQLGLMRTAGVKTDQIG